MKHIFESKIWILFKSCEITVPHEWCTTLSSVCVSKRNPFTRRAATTTATATSGFFNSGSGEYSIRAPHFIRECVLTSGGAFKDDSYPLWQEVPFVQWCPLSHLTPYNEACPLILTEYRYSPPLRYSRSTASDLWRKELSAAFNAQIPLREDE